MDATSVILIALLKTSGEGGAITLDYDTLENCGASGVRLENQFEALVLEGNSGAPVEGHPRVIRTCFEGFAGT